MLNTRTVVPILLVIALAFAADLIVDSQNEPHEIQEIARNDPDLYMVNATVTDFDENGQRQQNITAERFTHFPLTDITTLKSPDMELFNNEDSDTPWKISANNGRLLPRVQIRDELVELWDDVHAAREDADGNFIHIKTESLTVYPETDFAETDQKVFIDDNSGQTVAAGMQAHLKDNRFIFFSTREQRVHTTLIPIFDQDE